jgi:hypothetical protein
MTHLHSNNNPQLAGIYDEAMALDEASAVDITTPLVLAGDVPRFERLTLAQVMKMPPKEWLIDQVMGSGDLLMIFGAPGSSKTFIAIDMAFAAALGLSWPGRFELDQPPIDEGNPPPWAGRYEVARPLTVAYAAGEGVSGLAQRFQAAAEYYGAQDVPNLHIYTTAPQLYNASDPCNAKQ